MQNSTQKFKARCPNCQEIHESMPISGTCLACQKFSHSWFIYNEQEFFKNRRFNVIYLRMLIIISIFSLLGVFYFTYMPLEGGLLSFLLIPFIITERKYTRQLLEREKYNGHRFDDLTPWFYL